jgi:hypothetical protein
MQTAPIPGHSLCARRCILAAIAAKAELTAQSCDINQLLSNDKRVLRRTCCGALAASRQQPSLMQQTRRRDEHAAKHCHMHRYDQQPCEPALLALPPPLEEGASSENSRVTMLPYATTLSSSGCCSSTQSFGESWPAACACAAEGADDASWTNKFSAAAGSPGVAEGVALSCGACAVSAWAGRGGDAL